ncbi:multidrug resistance-associated protein 5, partial [Tanacetum coccineum]
TFSRLELYLDHLDMDLSEYLRQANTTEMDAYVSKRIVSPKKRASTTDKGKEKVSQDETKGVEAMTGITYTGKEKVSQDEIEGVEARTSIIDSDYDSEVNSDDDSEYDIDKSVDYLSPGKEKLIELRNRMKANREAKAKGNSVPEMNEPNVANSMPTDNIRGGTFVKHDIYINELLTRLKTTDKNGKTQDPFILAEKHVKKYPMYDETTHWKLRKPKVGKKYVTIEMFKECLTYYTLANGFSLWYEKSCGKRVVEKCGQRPPSLSDPNKGKQMKENRYPSVSSDELTACPWRCYTGWMTEEKTFQVKSLVDEHTRVRNFNFGSLVNYRWIGNDFGDNIRANQEIRLCDIADLVMKSPNQGEILTANGRDGINHIYPVASAVVNVENKENWSWFLELLEEDLGYSSGNRLTFMSDQHKGLIEVVTAGMPNVEHRQCARHIYDNFRKHYTGLEFRNLFWAASKASYPELFHKIIDKIKSANPNAHKYRMDKNPKTWSRAFFEVDRGCEAVENGFSECFNSVIVSVRHKPLITMVEAIRVIEQQRFWHVIPTGGDLFKVRSGSEGFTVDEEKRTCSCKMWQLSGIHCVHATKPGQSMYSIVLPPKLKKMLGRPRKKRVRSKGEGGSSIRESKIGFQGSCSNFKKPRHNKASCKEPLPEKTPKPKGVPGRPRKKQSDVNIEDADIVFRGKVRGRSQQGGNMGLNKVVQVGQKEV